MNRTTKPKGFGIAATMLLATLLIAVVSVSTTSAQVGDGGRISVVYQSEIVNGNKRIRAIISP